jgi:hypothetical protein
MYETIPGKKHDMTADLRQIRTKLYRAAQGKGGAMLDPHEAYAVLTVMGRSSGIAKCVYCGAPVRMPATLAEDGLSLTDDEALIEHVDGCQYVAACRKIRADRQEDSGQHEASMYQDRDR